MEWNDQQVKALIDDAPWRCAAVDARRIHVDAHDGAVTGSGARARGVGGPPPGVGGCRRVSGEPQRSSLKTPGISRGECGTPVA